MKVNKTKEEQINELLTRGVEDVFVLDSLKQKLHSGKKLRVKLGIDPTSSHIHIGRAIILRKLRKFQDLGHKAVIVIGDTTAQIGDPSDKLSKRPMLTEKDIKTNLKTYKKQISKIIDIKKAEFRFNSKWLSKLDFKEVCNLAETFSVQQMLSRRNFAERLEKSEEISLRELMYPLMQGYDSVAIKADIELGGFDQLFNLKAGRIIQKHYGEIEQDVMTFKMLVGTDGRKMSSSWGNVVAIDDSPNNIFGKIMSIKDELIIDYLTLTTDIPLVEIESISRKMNEGLNPKEAKMILAFENVKMYWGEKEAKKTKEVFINTFSKKDISDESFIEIKIKDNEEVCDTLLRADILPSRSQFSRLVDSGAVSYIEGEKITNIKELAVSGKKIKIGKKIFVKFID